MDMYGYQDFTLIAGVFVLAAVILSVIKWNIEKSRREKEMFDSIENMDTKALLGIELELKGIRSSLHSIEIVYGIVVFFVILAGARMF